MKKLLSLLSVLTISGTAVPTTIAASPYQKEKNNLENLNRNKRNTGSDCESDSSWSIPSNSYCSISPELWEEITIIINKNIWRNFHLTSNYQFLSNLINNKMNEFNLKGPRNKIVDTIIFSFDILNNEWQKSDKKHHIRIVTSISNCNGIYSTCQPSTHFTSVNIRDDWGIENNKYLSRLENDLKVFNLNLINNEKDETILTAIKNKNPNLDISQIEIANKESYSYFSEGFSVKVKVKNGSEKYSNGVVKNKFIFNTLTNINKINDIIKNNSNVITWINNLKDWNNDVKEELKTSVPKKTPYEKIEWKNRKKEDLKNYMLHWNTILNLIDHELKLEELNSAVNVLKQEISDLKFKINEINKKITTNDSFLENCSNYGSLISSAAPLIPEFGEIISVVAGVFASVCSIANA